MRHCQAWVCSLSGGLTPHEVAISYLEIDGLPEAGELPPNNFDAVAISSFSARIDAAYELARRYREAGVTVLLGGLHVTCCPDEAQSNADSIIIGEAEPVWPKVIHDLVRGELATRYDARALTFRLEDAPMPRYDLLEARAYDRFTLQTQRGCPWDCEFCAASIRLRPGFRAKPLAKIERELSAIIDLAPRAFVELADDNTFASRAHGRRVCQAMGRAGVRWFTETDVSFAEDEDLLLQAADSGCVQVLIGLESPSNEALVGIERKRDWKAKQADRYATAIHRVQSKGISVNGCFVLGLDGTGEEQFDSVLNFVRSSGLHEVQVTVMTAFPGTPLYTRLEAEGRLLTLRTGATARFLMSPFNPPICLSTLCAMDCCAFHVSSIATKPFAIGVQDFGHNADSVAPHCVDCRFYRSLSCLLSLGKISTSLY